MIWSSFARSSTRCAENRSKCELYAASLETIQNDLAGVEAKYREMT